MILPDYFIKETLTTTEAMGGFPALGRKPWEKERKKFQKSRRDVRK